VTCGLPSIVSESPDGRRLLFPPGSHTLPGGRGRPAVPA